MDLDEDEEIVLKEVLAVGEAAQLADINRVARLAANHELDFQPISRGWRIRSDEDERAVQALACDLEKAKRRRLS
ncbi:hypothetical protein [Brevundimonas sp.]|uniref:hypothetical protein n=1 Tax=Brevundimonas sp. TaxID=1871086 RepID=UPI002EDB2923